MAVIQRVGSPAKPRKWMSVHEMGDMLGLKKTDRYWLVHKNYFRTETLLGKMRVEIASFEKWYANQPSVIHQNLSPCLIPRSFHLLIIFPIMICSPVALHLLPGPIFLRQDSAGALILDAFVNAGPDQHCLCL